MPHLGADSTGVTVTWSDVSSASGIFLKGALARSEDLPQYIGATTAPGYARLVWRYPTKARQNAWLYRPSPDAGWAKVVELKPDTSGALTYEDKAAEPGTTLHCRLGFVDAGAEYLLNEVTVEIPRSRPLALGIVRPDPSGRSVIVSFSLPSAVPASIDVIDIAGRRVAHEAVGALGPGDHELRLNMAGGVPSGIYFVRLQQAREQRTKKVSVIR